MYLISIYEFFEGAFKAIALNITIPRHFVTWIARWWTDRHIIFKWRDLDVQPSRDLSLTYSKAHAGELICNTATITATRVSLNISVR
jgi:hypothetical protein